MSKEFFIYGVQQNDCACPTPKEVTDTSNGADEELLEGSAGSENEPEIIFTAQG